MSHLGLVWDRFLEQYLFFVGWTTWDYSLLSLFTGDHSNQDPRYTQKPIYYTIFAKHIWSWLLCSPVNRVFAIYQILLGWKTCKYYYETDELPNPRPTQPKKKSGWKWRLGHFFPTAKWFFVGWDWFYIGNRLQENLTQPSSPQTPCYIFGGT